MASFSFGSGNVTRLLTAPLELAGAFATLLIPRGEDRWVFGSAAGVADGAKALWDVAAGRCRGTWLTSGEADAAAARDARIPSAPKRSLRGFWLTARAGVVVITHGFGDVNRYAVRGAYVVQLWHGIPLKRLGLDTDETSRSAVFARSALLRALLRAAYRRAQRRIDLLPAASHTVRGRLESAFGLPDRSIPVTGEPRVDVLSRGSAQTRRSRARAAIAAAIGPLSDDKSIVLYAPTWRDGDPDPGVPTDTEWERILAVLHRTGARLLVRSHPLGAGDYRPPRPDEHVVPLGNDVVDDITPLLPGIDVLITDYSSIAYDAALVPVPTVFFAPDLAAYEARRGFYGRYRDVAGHDPATDWRAAADELETCLLDAGARAAGEARARELSARVHAFADGRNAERVFRAVAAGRARHRRARRGRFRRGTS